MRLARWNDVCLRRMGLKLTPEIAFGRRERKDLVIFIQQFLYEQIVCLLQNRRVPIGAHCVAWLISETHPKLKRISGYDRRESLAGMPVRSQAADMVAKKRRKANYL